MLEISKLWQSTSGKAQMLCPHEIAHGIAQSDSRVRQAIKNLGPHDWFSVYHRSRTRLFAGDRETLRRSRQMELGDGAP